MNVRYSTSLDGITAGMLDGFFVDWPSPPSTETHLRVLHGSAHVILAIDDDSGRVIGFINAISDGVMSAFIPLLEVLPEWHGRGIGSELVRQMRAELSDLYSVDLVCDADVVPFYERIGGAGLPGVAWRNFDADVVKRQ